MKNRREYLEMLARKSYPELLSLAHMAKMPYLPHALPYAEKMKAMRDWLEDQLPNTWR